MAKAIATYAGGIHGLVRYAVREDGALFVKYQDKTPWGYRWGAWQRRGEVDVANLPASISSGFSNCYRSNFGARLPA